MKLGSFDLLVRALDSAGVRYLVAGGLAVNAHGYLRFTRDVDLVLQLAPENIVSAFGAPLGDLNSDDLSKAGTIFQIGVPPLRIDLITAIDGVDFDEAWPDRFKTSFAGAPVCVISRRHLIQNKKTVARLQDLADVERLETEDQL